MTEESEIQDAPTVNVEKYNALLIELKSKENFVLAITAGIVSAMVGAGIWAAVTVATGYQIGWMAVGVGFLVGFSVRIFGKGISEQFGYAGAICALLGCIVGNFLTIVAFISMQESMGYVEVLNALDYSKVPELMISTFNIMDILFYGIAIYEGYKFSFKGLTAEEVNSIVD